MDYWYKKPLICNKKFMLWNTLADFILNYRRTLLAIIGLLTVFMAYMGRNVENTYDFVKVVPKDDPDAVFFDDFVKKYGEDGNIFAVGIKDSSLFGYQNFEKLAQLSQKIQALDGVNYVLSLPNLHQIVRNDSTERFDFVPVFKNFPKNQSELDTLLAICQKMQLYKGQIFTESGATMLAVGIRKDVLNSAKRQKLIFDILKLTQTFEQESNINLYYAGVPYVRTVMASKVKNELNFFLSLSVFVTVGVMFVFFRSFSVVFFTLLMVGIVVVWTIGILGVFGYKITLLTGLLPPVLVVIGIPNCVYMITKYHQRFVQSQNKEEALKYVVKNIGIVTFITNTTTAIGFLVLLMTNISILTEFGTVAGLSIAVTFLISIIFIPAVFSYLPSPSARHTKHLEMGFMNELLVFITRLIVKKRAWVYATSVFLTVASVFGIVKIQAVSYMIDDLPKESELMQDLRFFEENFKGVMPLEIVVDTGKRKGFRKYENLQKIAQLEDSLSKMGIFAPPISPTIFLKAANQAYFDNPQDFRLPNKREGVFIQKMLKNQAKKDSDSLTQNFVDTSQRYVRISLKVADLGSIKMDSLIKNRFLPIIDSVFKDTDLKAQLTGTTLLFIKGNKYLIKNLQSSLLLAIVLVAAIMGFLFRSVRMMILSVIPNLLPLLMVAAYMGYSGTPLKPSTALIFSVAFGISVDDSIHFLAKYRQELAKNGFNVLQAVQTSISETGLSMIYTSLVLFGGFIIFVGSEFGGTVALGKLTSMTLLIAMFTNLILLPSLLLSFDKYKK